MFEVLRISSIGFCHYQYFTLVASFYSIAEQLSPFCSLAIFIYYDTNVALVFFLYLLTEQASSFSCCGLYFLRLQCTLCLSM